MVRRCVPILWVLASLSGCTDPFSPVEPRAPSQQGSGHGSSESAKVPSDFWNALDSARTDRLAGLLSGTATFASEDLAQGRSALFTCASRISTGFSAPVSSQVGSIRPSALGTDTVVETFQYSLYRSGRRLANAQATWTVVRSGAEWTLLSWKESGQDSGWAQLCRNPR